MASYKKTVHTDKAFALIGKMVAGDISKLEFTKIKVSDKDYSKHTEDELKKLTALEQIKQETSVSEKTPVGDNAVNIHGIIYNTDLQNSYYLRTIGLYANDPDEGEILYSVTATEVGDYIPTPNGNNITTAIIDILTEISDAKVNLSGNPSALVDVSMLNKKLDRGEGLEKEFDSAVKIVAELKKKQNKEDGTLKTVVKTIVGGINELFDNKLEKGGYTGTAQNLLTEISKITSKSVLGRIIIGKGLSVDSSGRTSIVSKNDGITVNENDFQLNTVDNTTTDSGTKPLSARQGKKLEENKQNKNDSALLTTAKNIVGAINELFSVKANKAHSHGNSEITDIDASKIKTGTIDISRLPQAALERCVVVADDTARFKLTKSQVQVGDSVKVTSPDNLMYIVVDDNKLNAEAGYIPYSAAVKWDTIKDKPSTFPPTAHTQDWSTITGKPSSFTPSVHTHDDRYYTENEVNNLLNRKSNTDHNHDSIYLNKNVIGAVNSIETLNNATETGIYAVNGYEINGLYGWGFLYVTKNGGIINQYYVSHTGGTCYRQDWNGNIANGKWITQWDNNNFNPNDKANSNHSHTAGQVGTYTKGEIDTKFKNYCPVSVGSIDIRYDNKNPAEVYPSTTWELLSSDKYIRTGTTPLSTGGSNSVSITKTNLPNIKLKIDTVTATIPEHYHLMFRTAGYATWQGDVTATDFVSSNGSVSGAGYQEYAMAKNSNTPNVGKSGMGGKGNTGSISPSTETLGSGTALSIQPAYITLKFWKRLS